MGAVKPKKGSLCWTDLKEAFESKHPAFYEGKNGKTYINFAMWENDPPQNNATHSFRLETKKDSDAKSLYIGNIWAEKNPF